MEKTTSVRGSIMAKYKMVRCDLRKTRAKTPRYRKWTRGFQEHSFADEATAQDERVRAKGDLSRRRTIIQDEATGPGAADMPAVDPSAALPGRVIRVHGLVSVVEAADGRRYRCAVRRLLRTLATDERSIVTTGDRVWILPTPSGTAAEPSGTDGSLPDAEPGPVADSSPAALREGVIERVEPRHGLLTRAS